MCENTYDAVNYLIFDDLTATEKADLCCKEIINKILAFGSKDINPRPKYKDGTPAHTYSINHVLQTFDLSKGEFPLLSLRNIAVKSAIGEILWIYQDQSNSLDLLKEKYGVTWWDAWDIGDRTIGQCYGKTVKDHNIINDLIEGIKRDPDSRRHIINLWQIEDYKQSHGLKPCALFCEFNIRHEVDGDYMDGLMLLRSSDYLTAGSINQVQYVALLTMLAKSLGYKVGKFSNMIVNCQIYDRHVNNAKIMLERESVPANPFLDLPVKDFFDYTLDDFKIVDYPREKINKKNPQLTFELGI